MEARIQDFWPPPGSRSVGRFTDLRLFHEALDLAFEQEIITKHSLELELSERVQGLLFVERPSETVIDDLLRELRNFGWIYPYGSISSGKQIDSYILSKEGKTALELYRHNKGDFLRLLTTQMQKLYVIPGWFVDRLWNLNPSGQGEIVIPTPPRNWNPKSKLWEQKEWTIEFEKQAQKSHESINNTCPGAFPIEELEWILAVKTAWNRLSNLKRKKVSKIPTVTSRGEKEVIKTYAPRRRLALAMREAAVKLLFSSKIPNKNRQDFFNTKPLLPRTYMAWCPRLEALELIFYTDANPLLPGRLIFPTSVFRYDAQLSRYQKLNGVKNLKGESLWLHRPEWIIEKENFINILNQVYQRTSTRVGSLYVSLLDVRDEVCRLRRLSAACFDDFLEKTLRESIQPSSKWSISVETDIREDQRSGSQLLRRPAWINEIPHSLIAMTEI